MRSPTTRAHAPAAPLLVLALLLACSSTTPQTAADAAIPANPANTLNTAFHSNALNRLNAAQAAIPSTLPDAWTAYWHAGTAELSRYALRQARYGELRDGEAVVIFVTEDFLPQKQVKSERARPREAVVPVLKLNLHKRFPTGLYTYSAMTSVFSPIDLGPTPPPALKVTTSVQEWCGQVWTQLNHTGGGAYRARTFSYFEDEGDQDEPVPPALLEDSLWTRLRFGPRHLPLGELQVVPATLTSRLRHRPLRPQAAVATLTAGPDHEGTPTLRYTLAYTQDARSISWDVGAAFPHALFAWQEVYPEPPTGERLVTSARRTHVLRDAYWQHNRNADAPLRTRLGLGQGLAP